MLSDWFALIFVSQINTARDYHILSPDELRVI